MFAESFHFLSYTDDGIPFECCQKLSESLFLHFQLMVGASWSGLMYAATLDPEWGIFAAFYFVVYMLVVNVLLTDLVVGVIMSFYSIAQSQESLYIKSDEMAYQTLSMGKKLRLASALEAYQQRKALEKKLGKKVKNEWLEGLEKGKAITRAANEEKRQKMEEEAERQRKEQEEQELARLARRRPRIVSTEETAEGQKEETAEGQKEE